MPEMDTPGINRPNPTSPAYGVGSLKYDRDRRNKNKQSFEEAFTEGEQKSGEPKADESVAVNDTPEKAPLPGDLQEGEGIIRKDEEDGQLHVDIVV
jgi:hypothetical protein